MKTQIKKDSGSPIIILGGPNLDVHTIGKDGIEIKLHAKPKQSRITMSRETALQLLEELENELCRGWPFPIHIEKGDPFGDTQVTIHDHKNQYTQCHSYLNEGNGRVDIRIPAPAGDIEIQMSLYNTVGLTIELEKMFRTDCK